MTSQWKINPGVLMKTSDMTPAESLGACLRLVDAHDYFARNADLRMTTGDHARNAETLRQLAPALQAAMQCPEGWVLVPVELLDQFPELNPSNYDHHDACALNAWGVEVVLAAAPTPPAAEPGEV
jgi:hypothetical protein